MNAAGTASLLQRFFTDRLREQQGVSAHTVASYRDTFRLLLRFAAQQLKRGLANYAWKTSTLLSWRRSFATSNGSAPTLHAHATPVCPHCMLSFVSSRSMNLHFPSSASAFLRSP